MPAGKHGLSQFRESIRDTFIPLELRYEDRGNACFDSHFESRALSSLRITQGISHCSVPFSGELRRSDISTQNPDQFVLLISRSGRARHTQLGRSGITHPGKMILIHGRAPYQVEAEPNMSSLFINMPAALLRAAVGSPEDYCMIAMDAGHGLNGLFSEFMYSIWHKLDELSEPQQRFLEKEFLSFLTTALDTIEAQALQVQPAPSVDTHFDEISRYIDAHLGDFSLNVDAIAKAVRLSPSRLHAIARSKGSSIGQTILDRRLEQCRQTLADPRCRHRSITQVGLDWGFRNATHFSQAFKLRFGVSPRDYRKQASTAGSTDRQT